MFPCIYADEAQTYVRLFSIFYLHLNFLCGVTVEVKMSTCTPSVLDEPAESNLSMRIRAERDERLRIQHKEKLPVKEKEVGG